MPDWCCYLITMLASFLGPRLRGDHLVNKAAMVSLDGRGPSVQALMQFPLIANNIYLMLLL